MLKQIKMQNQKVDYILKFNRRARRLRLTVSCETGLVATAPLGFSQAVIEKFIRQKSRWILTKLAYFAKHGVRTAVSGGSRREYLANKDRALKFTQERLEYFNQVYNLQFNRISIRNPKTRWGSCSKKGNLNFSYKIQLLPPNLADYIIVHELCHLAEFNHSARFWQAVRRTIPDCQDKRKQLRCWK